MRRGASHLVGGTSISSQTISTVPAHRAGPSSVWLPQRHDTSPTTMATIARRAVRWRSDVAFGRIAMALHEGEAFTNERVVLDGNDYRNCTFTNCEIVFNA